MDNDGSSGPSSGPSNNATTIRRRRGSDDPQSSRRNGRDQQVGASGPGSPSPEQAEVQELGFPWNILASLVLQPLRMLTGIDGNLDPKGSVEVFVKDFETICSHVMRNTDSEHIVGPLFAQSSYRDALAEAAQSEKLLFVYLHSSQHPDTDRFCKDILCSRDVSNLVNDRMVAWGGCIEYAEAFRLSQLLNATTYPYVAILEPPANVRGTNAKLLEKVEGKAEFGSMVQKLTRATDQHGSIIAERVAQRYEASERQRLREEQDAALHQAMEEDRRREEERRRKREEEERLQREEEEAARREEEEAKRKEQERLNAIEAKRNSLPPEPEMVKGKVTTIRFQMPNGSRFQRRFANETTMGQIRNYVDCELHEQNSDIVHYALNLNFPKKTFTAQDDQTRTLKDNDMVPQAVLFIQDLDS